jgi:hypothetical protein
VSAPVSQRSRILLDSEYYTYTQPPPQRDVASQLGVTQPQQPSPSQPGRPISTQEYIAKTEHLYESQAQTPVSEYSVVKTGAGNVYVYTPSAGWQRLEYNPGSNTYSLAPASEKDIAAEISKLGGTGYKLDPVLAEKLAKEEPHALMWYGVEDALRYAKLRGTFPELAKEKWITEADVQSAIARRLESYGWRPTTREEYDALRSLSRAVMQNPDVWKPVESSIQRQLEEAQRKQEELSSFYAAKALKQWDAEREAALSAEALKKAYEPYAGAPGGFLEAMGAWAARSSWVGSLIAGLLGIRPEEPTDFEKGYLRLAELEAKKERYPDPWSAFLAGLSDLTLGLVPKPPRPGLTPQEERELSALEDLYMGRYFGKVVEYEVGAGVGRALGVGLDLAALKAGEVAAAKAWRATAGFRQFLLEATGLDEHVQRVSEALKPRLLSIGEKVGLVQREQLVPKTVESEVVRAAEGFDRYLAARTRVLEWGRAEELLGGKVPEGMRLKPGEVSVLPLEGGFKAPVVGEGGFAAARFEGLRFTWEKGWEPVGREWVYARGTGEESLVAARLASERFEVPRMDIAAVRARVDYAKILEQAQGGLPRSVLLTEEGDILASVSRTPRIPVREVFRPATERLPPPLLPPKLPVKEEVRVPQVITPLRLPVVEGFKSSVDLAPPRAQPAPRPQPVPLALGDIAAVITGAARAPVPAEPAAPRQTPRLEPRLELPQLPRPAPKVELPQLAAPASPPPQPPQLPKLPAPPLPIVGGVRDVPVPRQPRLFGSREWLVRWFGPGAPEVIAAARSRRGKRRRGGRK